MAKLPNYYKVSVDGLNVKLEPIYEELAEVVRCKDCKKAVRHEIFPWSRRCKVEDCKFSHKKTHFCSYGERREGE